MSCFGTQSPHLKTQNLQRSLWFFVQAGLVLAALLAGSRSAKAESCGHYLFRNGVPVMVAPSATAHNPNLPFHQPANLLQSPGVPSLPAVPCSGPGCRNRSLPTLPGSFPVTLAETTDPAILATCLPVCGIADESTAVPQSERIDLFPSNRIFRPPAC